MSGGDDIAASKVEVPTSSCLQLSCKGILSNAHANITALSPAGTSGNYNLSISVNRQQYRGFVPYTFYGIPTLSSALPASGPIAGGTNVSFIGVNLGGGDCTCRFGDTNPVFNGRIRRRLISCEAPAVGTARTMALRVAHNAQQYSRPA